MKSILVSYLLCVVCSRYCCTGLPRQGLKPFHFGNNLPVKFSLQFIEYHLGKICDRYIEYELRNELD